MRLIATHNSGTGECSDGWLSRLLVPFARCQSLTLREQYEEGVRLFDLRVRKYYGEYYICHGLWCSSMTLEDALLMLNSCASASCEQVLVMLTYEGELSDVMQSQFMYDMYDVLEYYRNIQLTTLNVKYPVWRTLKTERPVYYEQHYTMITGWRCLLPIPYLWWLFRSDDVDFDNVAYKMVDFYDE